MACGGKLVKAKLIYIDDKCPMVTVPVWQLTVENIPYSLPEYTCVYAEFGKELLPALGTEIWWQAGKIYVDNDTRTMRKIGYSFSVPAPDGA